MGAELLGHPRVLPNAPHGEIRFLAERLSEALADALRVAESRGRRLEGSSRPGGGGPPRAVPQAPPPRPSLGPKVCRASVSVPLAHRYSSAHAAMSG
ncbi:hypothetical protein GCM10010216_65650 [Streptomyces flaveolus]|nr:hypothetical protein GCM10010216_65650 [Streptomyces flaveolus]